MTWSALKKGTPEGRQGGWGCEMMAGFLTCAGDATVRGEEYTVGTWRETQDATSW